jgi:hypothetical protein
MRPKVRVLLPLAQVLLAFALITSNSLRSNPKRNPHSWHPIGSSALV